MRGVGFQKPLDTEGHGIPVVVREPPNSDYRKKASEVWLNTKTCTHRSAMRTFSVDEPFACSEEYRRHEAKDSLFADQ